MVGWLKNNWLIIVFAVLIIAAPTAGFIVSGMWVGGMTSDRAEEASSELRRVQGASVTYQLPPAEPGAAPVELSGAPNAKVTEWFREKRAAIEAGRARVADRAVEFNQGAHGVFVEGLFPSAASRSEQQRLAYAFASALLGSPDAPGAYDRLLGMVSAVEPVNPQQLATLLEATRDREVSRLAAERGPGPLSEDEAARLQQTLVQQRKSLYSDRVRSAGVYFTRDSFLPTDGSASGVVLPIDRPSTPPSSFEAFDWQWTMWVLHDLVRAVEVANRGPDGFAQSLASAPVKRIESISVEGLPEATAEEESGGRGRGRGRGAQSGPSPTSKGGLAPTDDSLSITGRLSHSSNSAYDVRRATLTVVVAGDAIDELFDAISRTNFMTVLGIRAEDVDVWADLGEGYYYGPGPVVRAEIEIETVWLREWLEPLMPDDIAAALGASRSVDGEL
ncbi:MAG: hypothetical protein AAGG07_10870 [Planctomycetota bacterium]